MVVIKKKWGYAPSDFTGVVKYLSFVVEKTQWGKDQDTLICVGDYDTLVNGKVERIEFGNVAITRNSLINQIINELGAETDKYTGAVFTFSKGKLLNVSFEV